MKNSGKYYLIAVGADYANELDKIEVFSNKKDAEKELAIYSQDNTDEIEWALMSRDEAINFDDHLVNLIDEFYS